MQLSECINLSLLLLLRHTSPHLESTQSSRCDSISPKPNTDNGTPHDPRLPRRRHQHHSPRKAHAPHPHPPHSTIPLRRYLPNPLLPPHLQDHPSRRPRLTLQWCRRRHSRRRSPLHSHRHALTTGHSRHQLQPPTHAPHHPRYPLCGSIHCCCCLDQSKTSWK